MDIHSLRSAYLNIVDDGLQAFETPDGFMVWVPLYHSDGDGVAISVRPSDGGWIISDDGSTYSALRSAGAAVATPAFDTAWETLSRPGNGFVPNDDATPEEISAWATDSSLGAAINSVALACVRGEGLNVLKTSDRPTRFSITVGARLRLLVSDARAKLAGFTCQPGNVLMKSGRSRQVGALLSLDHQTIAAFQPLAGSSASSRESSFEHCYTLFAQADLERDRRIAVVRSPDAWKTEILDELSDVATLVPWSDSGRDFDAAFWKIVDNQELTTAL